MWPLRTTSQRQWRRLPPAQSAEPALGPVITSLDLDSVVALTESVSVKSAVIQDSMLVASYNLLNKRSATILVPGRPPRWTPSRDDIQLREDSGRYYRDKNAAKFPNHPFAPAITACLASSPSVLDDVDVVACGSTLGNLLRFVRGQDKKCRMLVEKVGKAVFFIRREDSPTELIPDVRGYGHAFPEAFTTWESEVITSASHQRVIKYAFGGMKLLVRFEADGYLSRDYKGDRSTTETKNCADASAMSNELNVDDLANLLLSTDLPAQQPPKEVTNVQLKNAGYAVDQAQIFDLKTRSIRTIEKDHMGEELPRLWVSQIPNFVLAFHAKGLFRKINIHIRDARDAVRTWEAEHKAELIKFATLIRHMASFAAENGRFELTLDGSGKLDIREQLPDAGDALPADLKHRWETVCGQVIGEPKHLVLEANRPGDGNVAADTSVFDWHGAGGDLTNCSEHCNYCGSCF